MDLWNRRLEPIASMCSRQNPLRLALSRVYVDIPLCHELGVFLQYANGIQDPDFSSSGICPFEPVPPVGIQDAFPKRAVRSDALPTSKFLTSRFLMKEYLEDSILDKTNIDPYVDEDLEAKVDFLNGTGCRAHHENGTVLICIVVRRRIRGARIHL